MIKKWFFDHYNPCRQNQARSWVQLADTDGGQSLTVHVDGEQVFRFEADLDQWGTWIGIDCKSPGVTVAQEWSTKSFAQALLAGLTEFAKICDLEDKPETQKPEYQEELTPDEEQAASSADSPTPSLAGEGTPDHNATPPQA